MALSAETLVELPFQKKLIALAIVIVAILGAYLYLSYVPKRGEIQAKDEEINKLTNEKAEKEIIAANLDAFKKEGIRFALEVHPTEIAYDLITARRTLDALKNHPSFGFNFDPSHFIHQFINPVAFIEEFPKHIFHCHVKDSRLQLNGRNSILGSHLDFGDARRGWDFVSPGRGDVKWDPIVRAFNRIGYNGPLSIEWEDSGMDRDWGAPEALAMIRTQDFAASSVAFDAAFAAK